MAAGIAYRVLEVLNSRTEGMFGISIFIKWITLLGVPFKVSGMLDAQVGVKLIDKPVFVQFHLSRKALNFVDNHLKLRDVVTGALAARKSKVV